MSHVNFCKMIVFIIPSSIFPNWPLEKMGQYKGHSFECQHMNIASLESGLFRFQTVHSGILEVGEG